jgi:hypothetical protein
MLPACATATNARNWRSESRWRSCEVLTEFEDGEDAERMTSFCSSFQQAFRKVR